MTVPSDFSQDETGGHPDNRMATASSPYLQQHAHHPVAWHPWDDQALQEAQLKNKPIFLSIGYAACHWCHVMARESFEDPATAALMNRHFVNIKVDREERPDLDELYMAAVVALTGRGGWPASIFLTPDLEPFYGGTYFPPVARYGMPSFSQLLEEIARLWQSDKKRILDQASTLTNSLKTHFTATVSSEDVETDQVIHQALSVLEADFDNTWGGWGGAPKFPSAPSLALLLRQWQRQQIPHHLHMVEKTLQQMAAGGMYDHVGGGFHRYAVDAQWKVPHFEKMLYDNAHLVMTYLEAWKVTEKKEYRRVVEKTLDYVLRDLRDKEGGFYSSEDADSEGLEGKFYLWTWKELRELLSPDELAYLRKTFSLRPEGNFESPEQGHHGLNIFFTKDLALNEEDLWSAIQKQLFVRRSDRIRPGLDSKIIASWNGLILSALSKASFALDNQSYKEAALKLGLFIEKEMIRNKKLYRIWHGGTLSHPAYLEDYGAVILGLIDLYQCSFEAKWLHLAADLGERMVLDFHDEKQGGFFNTSDDHKDLFARLKTVHDAQEVTPGTTAGLALLKLAWYFERDDYRELVHSLWKNAAQGAMRAIPGHMNLAVLAETLQDGFTDIVVVATENKRESQAMIDELRRHGPINALWAVIPADKSQRQGLFPEHASVEGKSTAHVCMNQNCLPPITELEELKRTLQKR